MMIREDMINLILEDLLITKIPNLEQLLRTNLIKKSL